MSKSRLLIAILFALAVVSYQWSQDPWQVLSAPSARAKVEQAWEKATENGVYHYATTIIQTTRPLPKLKLEVPLPPPALVWSAT